MARRWRTRAPYGSWLLGRPGQSPRAVRIRVQLLLTGLLLATNLVGAAVVVVIATVVLPLPPASGRMVVATAVAVPVYVAVAIVLGTWIGTASSLRALRWQYDDEPPDARAVRRTLRVPVRLTALQFALWATATVLFTVLASVLQPERALGVGLTVGTASIAQARGRIAETELKILQIDQDFRSGVAKELADIRAKYAETVEKHVTARDQLNRLDIRSPQAGVVHDLIVHTAGAVITPGETIMTIVPDNDVLQIETRVQPKDIDQIHIGSSAMLRFTSFDARTTPEIDGTVRRIGADLSHDDKSTEPYFVVRLDVDPEQQEKLGKARLIPGMPVEVFIRTSARSMLSYLMKPLADQARRAFREK